MIGVVLVLGIGGVAAVAEDGTPGKRPITAAGAPASPEFDPANQRQSTLLEAASRENPPAADDIILGRGTPRAATEATRDVAAAGNAGCVPQYGKEGQCLPLVPPSQMAHAGHTARHELTRLWTCAEVRTIFPEGVALGGKADPLGLDSNKDRIACGKGDDA